MGIPTPSKAKSPQGRGCGEGNWLPWARFVGWCLHLNGQPTLTLSRSCWLFRVSASSLSCIPNNTSLKQSYKVKIHFWTIMWRVSQRQITKKTLWSLQCIFHCFDSFCTHRWEPRRWYEDPPYIRPHSPRCVWEKHFPFHLFLIQQKNTLDGRKKSLKYLEKKPYQLKNTSKAKPHDITGKFHLLSTTVLTSLSEKYNF